MDNDVNEKRIVKTLCRMCGASCGIDVHTRGGTITRIARMKEHLYPELCIKSSAIPDLQYSKNRLLHPLKKVNGNWKQISWDEALDTIITKLTYVKERYGPQSTAVMYGHVHIANEISGLMNLFCEAYGTPNFTGVGAVCHLSKELSFKVTVGRMLYPHFGHSKLILSWGQNTWHSGPPTRPLLRSLKGRDVKLIVVDPRRTEMAKMSDLHLQLRPGTDWALALGLLNVIISEELYDKDFVTNWTVGFNEFAEAIKDYTAEKVGEITWVPADKIVQCARMYASIKPAAITTDAASIDHHTNTFQTGRAWAILHAICGNLDIVGGNKFVPLPHHELEHSTYYLERKPTPGPNTIGADRYPLFMELAKQCQGCLLPEVILTEKPYPVKAVLVSGLNPAATFPNTSKVKRALESLDFLMVMDIFMTETAQFADIVLPAATFLEKRTFRNYIFGNLAMMSMTHPVFEPSGECWPDTKFWLTLGRRMGYEKYFPWKNEDELLEDIMKAEGKTLKDMDNLPGGFFHHKREVLVYEQKGFNTPSGKVEIYSQHLKDLGIEPMPINYYEPAESPVSTPGLAKQYPLIATSGARIDTYMHSQGRNLPRLRSRVPDPEIEIHLEDAQKYGIQNGDWATIESRRGTIKMRAKVTEDILSGVISIPHGWGGNSNVNYLTDDETLCPVSGFPAFRSFLCRVKKAA